MSQTRVRANTARPSTRRGGRGGNVYNIHQPARHIGQGAITRDESVRRLENEYAEKLRVHKIKEQEKEAKKREERLAKYKYVDQGHRLTEGYLDEAVGGQGAAHVESEEEIRQRQQDQLRRDALVFQEQERKKNEERIRREEEMMKQKLERYKHVSSGHRLGGGESEARQESENKTGQFQQHQLRRDVLINHEQERMECEDRIRKKDEPSRQEVEKCKPESSSSRLSTSTNEGSFAENGKRNKIDNSGKVTNPTDITSLFVEFMKTSGIMKNYTNGETDELLSQFQIFMSNAKSTPNTKATNLEPPSNETPASSDSQNESKNHASCTASTPKGPVLVIRPCQEALDHAVSQSLALQDMDKHGQSSLYEPQIEQTPAFSNNRFQWKQPDNSNNRLEQHSPSKTSFNRVNEWKPQSETTEVGTRQVQKSLDEIAKLTGAIPKQKPVVVESRSPDCNPATSNEPGCSGEMEIDFQEEIRAARLRMQKRYDEALKKQQNN